MASDSDFKRDVAKIILDKGILATILLVVGLWANRGLAQFQANLNGRVEELKQQLALAKGRTELRTEVATAFFKVVSQNYENVLSGDLDPTLKKSAVATAEAEARVAVFGAPEVVKAYAAFKNGGMKLSTPEGQRNFLELVGAIRKDFSGASDSPSTRADIGRIFFAR